MISENKENILDRKKYIKPILEEEYIELEDICAISGRDDNAGTGDGENDVFPIK